MELIETLGSFSILIVGFVAFGGLALVERYASRRQKLKNESVKDEWKKLKSKWEGEK